VTTADGLVARCRPIADGLAALFHPHVEVVVHDLATQTVAYIANNLSRRALGDESALDEIRFHADEDVIGPYEKIHWNGARIRSISVVTRDAAGAAVGLICVNMDLSVFEGARTALSVLLDRTDIRPQPDHLFKDDWQERINLFLRDWLSARGATLAGLGRTEKRALIEALYAGGGFTGRSAAPYVANLLGLSRATVFNILKPLRSG
jgi:predicted transcriptional regulator YheO